MSDLQAEVEARFALVRERYGDRLAPEELEAVRTAVEGLVQAARARPAVRGVPGEPVSDERLVFAPVRRLAALVRERKVSPVALAETFLERLERLGPRYNAVVTITRERALAQARRAERELADGHYRGPLHGIPYGAKDLLATSGDIPTTWGAAIFRDRRLGFDATAIRRLEQAGAVLCAKLAMVELAG